MTLNEKLELTKIIGACWILAGRDITAEAISMVVDDLCDYPFAAVMNAINEARKKNLLINSGNVVPLLQSIDGRPDANVAWSMALEAMDENATVIWSDEMATAWGLASPLFDIGDKTGARMAFKESYERSCDKNRKLNLPTKFWPSYGRSVEQRIEAISKAQEIGLIPLKSAVKMIKHQGGEPTISLNQLRLLVEKRDDKLRMLGHG